MTKKTIYFCCLMAICCLSCNSDSKPSQEEKAQPANPEAVSAQVAKEPSTAVQIDTIIQKPIQAPPELSYIIGRFEPSQHPDFVRVALEHADREGLYLRKETYEAFKKMHAAAAKEGIRLQIRSATRNFKAQKRIWEGKWNGIRKVDGADLSKTIKEPKPRALKILEYSSMPGTSRHHWGTDIDLNAFINEYFERGDGLKLYNWMVANAASYGFCQPYTQKGPKRPDGYNEENGIGLICL